MIVTKNWELSITNIGVFKGKHEFNLKTGLNILGAPNASGKTSLINSIRLLSTPIESDLGLYLNSSSLTGDILLKNNKTYQLSLIRGENATQIVKEKLLSKKPVIDEIAFLTNDNPFIKSVEEGSDLNIIYEWLKKITDLEYYEKAFSIVSKIGSDYQLELEKLNSDIKIKESQIEMDILELTNKKKNLEKRLSTLRKSSNDEDNIEELRNQHSKIAHEISLIQNRLRRYKGDFEENNQAIIDLQKIEEKLSYQLEEIQNQFSNAELEIKKIEKSIVKTDEEIVKQNEKLDSIKFRTNRLTTIKEEINTAIVDERENCVFCNNKINPTSLKKYYKIMSDELAELENDLSNQFAIYRKLEIKKSDLAQEIQDFQISLPRRKRNLENEMTNIKNRIQQANEVIKGNPEKILLEEKKLSDFEVKYNDVQSKLIDLTSTDDDNRKLQNDVIVELNNINQKIADFELDLYKTKSSSQRVLNLEKLINIIKLINQEIQIKITYIQDQLIDKINMRISECFESLKFLDFSSLKITDELKLIIKRKPSILTEFKELSSMERILIGIIISFSVLKAFYPEFPIFAIDDPLNGADDIRFQKLVKYLSTEVPLLIVTRNLAKDESEFKVLTQENIIAEI